VTLAKFLESKFRGDIRFRGTTYVKAERVAVTRVTADDVFAVVRDGIEYQTQLSRRDGELRMHCDCAADVESEVACKHLWATILCVDDGDYLSASPRPGQVPPFVSDTADMVSLEFDPADRLDDEDLFNNSGGADRSAADPGGLAVADRLRPWEQNLNSLRQEMASRSLSVPTAGHERQIFYEIDVAGSREGGRLVIQTSQRQRRASGQWGKLKPLKLRPGQADELELEQDRRILAFLSGASPERTNWYAQQAETKSTAYRYRIPYELCVLILPMMCTTGRVRFLDQSENAAEPLVWDDAPAWELALRVVHDVDNAQWCLVGELERGPDRLPLREPVLLVPGGLVLTNSRIARLEDFGAFEWVKLLRRDEPVTVPSGEEQELVDRLLDMPAIPRLHLPEELRLDEVRCDPSPRLTIRSPRGAIWNRERLTGEVTFEYPGVVVRGSSVQWAIVQREAGRILLRNRELEERSWGQLEEHGFRRLLDHRRGGHDVEIAARDLGSAVRALIAEGWDIRADGQQVRQPGALRFRVTSEIDWFELRADVDFEGQTVAFPELLSALARGEGTVRLDDGSLGILPEDWARQYGLLSGLGVPEGDHIRLATNQVALLDALLAAEESVDYDEKFEDLRRRFVSFDGVQSVQEPDGFQGELRNYQRDGLGWLEFLQEFGFGGCLADDMGLGKTVQLLALLLDRKRTAKQHRPSLIVVPKSLIFNWQQESSRFTPQLSMLEYVGTDRQSLRDDLPSCDLVLTTYGTLRRDAVILKNISFDYVVLDEAQTIKNAGSQVARAARLLRAEHRVALSGTPIENHLSDLWSILEFLNPGMLGRSSLFKTFTADDQDSTMRETLARALRPFILRRTKAQVASELPDKIEQTILCDMGDEQARLYNELRDHYRRSLLGLVEQQGMGKSTMHVLEALLRLRQVACHPALLNKGAAEDASAKLDILCPHLDELVAEGHKALVFSQFTSMLAVVRQHLDERGIVYEYLDGRTRDRKSHVERFQNDPDCGVFLISLKAGGLGLNLTAADYVFLLDPWWNPAVEAQAIDRAHRVGQTRPVFAYRLICRGTVEEKIAELQIKKKSLADSILEANDSLLKDLSTDDLKALLS